MADRCTDAQLRERELAALELLANGHGSAASAHTLASRYGCSLRQARRYVTAAALDLCEPMTPHFLDVEASLVLYRLDLLCGRAMDAQDEAQSLRVLKAQASALAQYRRAVTVPVQRFRLKDQRPPTNDHQPLPF
jgi:hypothetical protein